MTLQAAVIWWPSIDYHQRSQILSHWHNVHILWHGFTGIYIYIIIYITRSHFGSRNSEFKSRRPASSVGLPQRDGASGDVERWGNSPNGNGDDCRSVGQRSRRGNEGAPLQTDLIRWCGTVRGCCGEWWWSHGSGCLLGTPAADAGLRWKLRGRGFRGATGGFGEDGAGVWPRLAVNCLPSRWSGTFVWMVACGLE